MNTSWSRLSGAAIRDLCRRGEFDRSTAGVALGHAQANLVMVRTTVADDFERFCRLNPQACPLLERTAAGQYEPVATAPGADLRTDLPRYRVLRNGLCATRPTSVVAECSEAESDGKGRLAAFLIGCSFTFETALLTAGLPVRHFETGRNVPMYRTHIVCAPAGAFGGPLVVSMRPMTAAQAAQASEITRRLPTAHGGPIQIGNPQAIGIHDLDRPDYGDPVPVRPGEEPVFWACGVTPMEALLQARLDLAITHEPGHMFVTDLRE